jgi:hypothetical protein
VKTLPSKIFPGYGAGMLLVAVILVLAVVLLLRLGRTSDALLQENYLSSHEGSG